MDQPPSLSAASQENLTQLVGSIPPVLTPFDPHTWDRIATVGDGLVHSAGSLSTAAHAFVAEWRKTRNPANATPQSMELPKCRVHDDIFQTGLALASLGAKAHPHEPARRFRQGPYPSAVGNPLAALEHLRPDVLEDRLFAFTYKSDDYTESLMDTRLSFVEKKDKIRYICDPRLEANERTDSKRHPLLAVPTIPSLRMRILYWKRRYPDIPILLAKRDVKSAFKLIPLSISIISHAGFRVAIYILVYISLYFGWKGSLEPGGSSPHSPCNLSQGANPPTAGHMVPKVPNPANLWTTVGSLNPHCDYGRGRVGLWEHCLTR